MLIDRCRRLCQGFFVLPQSLLGFGGLQGNRKKNKDCGKLRHHAKRHHGRQRDVERTPITALAHKPEHPVCRGEYAISRRPPLRGCHRRNRCRDDGFMHADTQAPDSSPSEARPDSPKNTKGAKEAETSVSTTRTAKPKRSKSRPEAKEPAPLTAMATA